MRAHAHETHVGDSYAGREGRGYIEAQIFSDYVFDGHGVINNNAGFWGFHPENNTIDVINPFKIRRNKRHFKNWKQAREALATDGDLDILRRMEHLMMNPWADEGESIMSLMSAARSLEFASNTARFRKWETDAARYAQQYNPDIPATFPVLVLLYVATELEIDRHLVESCVKTTRVYVPTPYTLLDPNAWHVLVPTMGDIKIAPNGVGLLVPAPGHASNPEAQRRAMLAGLAKMPFDLCGGSDIQNADADTLAEREEQRKQAEIQRQAEVQRQTSEARIAMLRASLPYSRPASHHLRSLR